VGNVSSAEKTWSASQRRGGSERPLPQGAYEPVTAGPDREGPPLADALESAPPGAPLTQMTHAWGDPTRLRHVLGQPEEQVAALGWLWDLHTSLRLDRLLVIVELEERAA